MSGLGGWFPKSPREDEDVMNGPQPVCPACGEPLGSEPCGPFHGDQMRGLMRAVANNRRLEPDHD